MSVDGNVDEKIKKLENLLLEIIRRLDMIEKTLTLFGSEVKLASRLASSLSLSVIEALESARRIIELTRGFELDEISRSIIEILSDCKSRNISEITRLLKRYRGKASRRIVRNRLDLLVKRGLIVNIGTINRPLYTLRNCLKNQ